MLGLLTLLEQTGGDSFAFNYESKWNSGTFFKDSSGVGEYFATRFGVAKRTATSPPPPPAAPAPGPAPKATPPPDYATPVSTWNVYAGEYEDPFAWLGKITVTKSATGLMISIPDHGVERALEQTGGDSFAFNYESKWNSGTFFKDSSGVGEYFATRFGVAKRTATSPPPPPAAPAPGPAPKATPAYDPAMWAHAHDHRSSWLRP